MSDNAKFLETDVDGWKRRYGELSRAVDAVVEQAGEISINTTVSRAFVSLLKWCVQENNLAQVRRVHDFVSARHPGCAQDQFVGNMILQAYRKLGQLDLACAVFAGICNRDLFSWTIMIAAFARDGHFSEALLLFRRMELDGIKPSPVTCVTVLASFTGPRLLPQARKFHARIEALGLESNVIVGTAVITMYGKCGSLTDSRLVFERMPQKNLVTWTTLISTYAQHGHGKEAIEIFERLLAHGGLEPDAVACVSALDACSSLASLEQGRKVHRIVVSRGFESNTVVANALVFMYGKCGAVEESRAAFDTIQHKNRNSWNCMLTVYTQGGHFREAMELFKRIDVEPDHVTFLCLVLACSGAKDLAEGIATHRLIEESEVASNEALCHSLMNMYSKLGRLESVREIFEKMASKNVISWTSIVSAHAQAGDLEMTQSLFAGMQLDGVAPDSIAFVSVLSSCSHGGLLESFPVLLRCMVEDCEILPRVEHYGCVVDALGRCGKLDEAERFVEELPVRVAVLWIALLAACSTHKDVRRARRVAERAFALEPRNWSTYVMFANILGEAGERDESAAIKQRMEELKARSQEKGAHIS
ncbi:pentatricopeptide repeat-containing protein DOT4, chloroplastic [Selaginella moellendorffii]|uniref:pentatricopeptide repeat-containing protein DOT4, chloroplastic n=1 Tax=Selaginella moellendorffii TaxID=88036 RepID=UPI000D1CCF39|nr:pentatricopeptide repeat-containing protein DOT4, chloroplastic [Selaginella moellendorffii]|eukprot:XP_024542101.1 pentatricopeptide repeat-containing protein DOT4, chloroplastic [Selaginella moellendorffii]